MPLTAMSLNVQLGANVDGRWDAQVDLIHEVEPDFLLLQEVDWLADPNEAKAARDALGMDLFVAPSRQLNTAVAWKPQALEKVGTDTRYSATDLHHGYALVQFKPLGLAQEWPVPFVVISAHLTPFSVEAAGPEAQLVVNRAYRYGGIGLVGGDINHLPLDDPEPDWSLVQSHNRAGRCHRRTHPGEPWRGNRLVGEVFRDGEMTDVAGHLADLQQDPFLRQPTAVAGHIRVDQFHVTPALVPALVDYRLVDTGDGSDHDGVVATVDPGQADLSAVREYA